MSRLLSLQLSGANMKSALAVFILCGVTAGSFFSGYVTHDAISQPKLRDLTDSPLTFVEDRCTHVFAKVGHTLEWTGIEDKHGYYIVEGTLETGERAGCQFLGSGELQGAAYFTVNNKRISVYEMPLD